MIIFDISEASLASLLKNPIWSPQVLTNTYNLLSFTTNKQSRQDHKRNGHIALRDDPQRSHRASSRIPRRPRQPPTAPRGPPQSIHRQLLLIHGTPLPAQPILRHRPQQSHPGRVPLPPTQAVPCHFRPPAFHLLLPRLQRARPARRTIVALVTSRQATQLRQPAGAVLGARERRAAVGRWRRVRQ